MLFILQTQLSTSKGFLAKEEFTEVLFPLPEYFLGAYFSKGFVKLLLFVFELI